MQGSGKYDQETRLAAIFTEMRAGFKKADGISDLTKQQSLLHELTDKMQDAKSLIKEFEREARTDGVPPADLAARKKALVQELNSFIGMKKERSADLEARRELTASSSHSSSPEKLKGELSVQQLVEKGRREMKAQDDSLIRAQRIVESTIEVGTRTAETLQAQGEQMERVLDTLHEIQFSMKKAGQVIRDITRGIATDKCIMVLLMVIIVVIVVIIILKLAGVGGKSSALPLPTLAAPPPPPPSTRRRMLREPFSFEEDGLHIGQRWR